jgi:hypothetical protein
MNQDPGVRREAAAHLTALFQGIGNARQESDPTVLGGLAGDLEEFMSMPLDLAMIFLNMATDLTELVLRSLEEAGIVLVKGLTPA